MFWTYMRVKAVSAGLCERSSEVEKGRRRSREGLERIQVEVNETRVSSEERVVAEVGVDQHGEEREGRDINIITVDDNEVKVGRAKEVEGGCHTRRVR